jgi:hypothetical protein
VERLAVAGKTLAPAESVYIEEDFIMNLLETVLDYQMRTTTIVRALEHLRANRLNDVRTLDDRAAALSSYPDDRGEHGAGRLSVGQSPLDEGAATSQPSR